MFLILDQINLKIKKNKIFDKFSDIVCTCLSLLFLENHAKTSGFCRFKEPTRLREVRELREVRDPIEADWIDKFECLRYSTIR
jgi:hypothetical protein